MSKRTRPLSLMSLAVMAMAITACGSTPLVNATPNPAASSGDIKLVTLRVGPSVSSQALSAALPGAKVLMFDHTTSRAVMSVPVTTASTLSSAHMSTQALGSLDAGVLAVEDDAELRVQGDDPEAQTLGLTTWAGGLTTWAGGAITWAGGAITWAGGTSFLNTSDLSGAAAYWNKLGIATGQKLAPELGTGVTVAVIDTGIDLNHPLLQGRLDTANDWDFLGNDGAPAEQNPLGATKYGHGTAVAGIILQIAPNAKIQAYRALDPYGIGSLSNVTAAVNKAVMNGADVINLSLGSTSNSVALNTAIAAALAKGVLVVNSSGNSGVEGILYPGKNLGTTQFPMTSGLISVGSVTMDLKKSKFSTYGKNLKITAPGEFILSTYPDSRIVKVSGTSFAAPAVSGALALALSTGQDSRAVNDALTATTTPNADPYVNAELGAGTLNVGALVHKFR
ncbi:S8 family serine peptidase [Deinococcus sp.]|uniref:S8 family serine peptidase n=1 Tax=Deinococcus sp. TaxID=47478 RepID=UPI002869CD26|nr:S8 family serine peptidase [Deinococcus sp.]